MGGGGGGGLGHRAVGNMPGYRCMSDCRSRGHEIISTVILLPLADSFKKGFVSYKRKYVHKLLVNLLFKPAQEKVLLGELTIRP